MTTEELEQLLRLSLAALRAQAGQPVPEVGTVLSAASLPAVQGLTVGAWLDVYERLLGERNYQPQTIRNHSTTLGHVRRIWGAALLRALKPHEVSAGLQQFMPDRSSTAKRVLAALRDVYAEAVANSEAEHNPALVTRQPKHSIKRGRLSLEHWQAMLERSKAHPQRWLRAMLLLALMTGQRRGDLAKMRFDDVVDGCLRVEQEKKAGKPRGARIALPLTLRLDSAGMSLADVIELCKTIAKPGETLLRKANGKPIEASSLSARFHELIVDVLGPDAYGDREWPSLHEVRSLSAREYRRQGLDDVQGVLGHKHAEMTAVYEDARDLHDNTSWRMVQIPT